MTTIHAYTADQSLLDAPHKDMRRARAAAVNLVPTIDRRGQGARARDPRARRAGSTGSPCACRPPPARSSTSRSRPSARPTVDEINAAFAERADRGALAGILAYSEEPLVSSDIVGSPYSAIFDARLTSVVDGTQVKVVAWYDNEWGYSNRLVELAGASWRDDPPAGLSRAGRRPAR